MNTTELLLKQTGDTYNWVNKLVDSISLEKWEECPKVIESSVNWQVGHLLMSFYYHTIMVISGHQMDILQKVPLKNYNELFTSASPANSVGKVNPKELLDQFRLVQKKSIETISALSQKNLEESLEPTEIPHPIANNKFEALDWNIKHTMWHCGQLGILKRILTERMDFGLKLNKY